MKSSFVWTEFGLPSVASYKKIFHQLISASRTTLEATSITSDSSCTNSMKMNSGVGRPDKLLHFRRLFTRACALISRVCTTILWTKNQRAIFLCRNHLLLVVCVYYKTSTASTGAMASSPNPIHYPCYQRRNLWQEKPNHRRP